MANTTWNPSDKATNITLSGLNLVATASSGVAGGVRSVSGKRTGKWYVEFTCTTWDSSLNTGVGLTSAYASLTNMVGSGAVKDTTSVNAGGAIYSLGVNTGYSIGAVANGDIVCMAVDFDNRQAWFRHNGGSWNASSGTANDPTVPSTGVYLGPYTDYLAFSSNLLNGAVTLNAGDSAFTYSVPTGYTSGWDTVDTTGPRSFGSLAKKLVGIQPAAQTGSPGASIVPMVARAPTPGPKTVSGTAMVNGTATAGLLVRAYAKATGELIGQALTNGSGHYAINCGANWADVTVVAYDPNTYQAMVLDRITPA